MLHRPEANLGGLVGLSALVIVLSFSLAFSPWTRALLGILVRVPLILIGEYSGIHGAWKKHKLDHDSLKRRSHLALEHVFKRRQQKKDRAANSDGAEDGGERRKPLVELDEPDGRRRACREGRSRDQIFPWRRIAGTIRHRRHRAIVFIGY